MKEKKKKRINYMRKGNGEIAKFWGDIDGEKKINK